MAIHSFDFGKLWSSEFLMPNGHPDSQDWARLKYSVERSALGIYDGAQNLGDLAIRKIFYGLDLTAPYWDRARVTDLTDAGDSALHYHATDRDLANATGTLAIVHGGTGQTTAQDAINALTQVSGATVEHV